MLIDDMISDSNVFNKKQDNLLTTLFFMGRHFGISLIITSQKYHSIPSGMLSNASQLILFRLKTQREIDSFYDSITQYDNLEERYKYATSEQYSFLIVTWQHQNATKVSSKKFKACRPNP